MNGRISKRIRFAARLLSRTRAEFSAVVKRLKREYKLLPYHGRTRFPIHEGHSAFLRRIHVHRRVKA